MPAYLIDVLLLLAATPFVIRSRRYRFGAPVKQNDIACAFGFVGLVLIVAAIAHFILVSA